jgi:hypothetical protein
MKKKKTINWRPIIKRFPGKWVESNPILVLSNETTILAQTMGYPPIPDPRNGDKTTKQLGIKNNLQEILPTSLR